MVNSPAIRVSCGTSCFKCVYGTIMVLGILATCFGFFSYNLSELENKKKCQGKLVEIRMLRRFGVK